MRTTILGPMALLAGMAACGQADTLTWDINDTTNQVIEDGSGTWSGSHRMWNDASSITTNRGWDNTANAADIAVFGGGGLAGTVTNPGTDHLAGITFNTVTGSYAIVGGDLGAPGNLMTITNHDTGNDRRTGAGALIASRLTGVMRLVFAGNGDNVALANPSNDFTGPVELRGGGVQVGSDTCFAGPTNRIEVTGTGSTLLNTAACTSARSVVLTNMADLTLVNGGNVLSWNGPISGGDSNTTLNIGSAHTSGNGNHRVVLAGLNTMTGRIRIYNQLRAYEGAGLSPNANITLGDAAAGSANAPNTSGLLETGGNFSRGLGAGAGQIQWEATGAYGSGGFSAVGQELTINLGAFVGPTNFAWDGAGFVRTGHELRFQNNNATHPVRWRNPIDLNGSVRTTHVGNTVHAAVLEGRLSGSGGSGMAKTGPGTLVLAASNDYAGATFVRAGVMQLATNGALPGGIDSTAAGGNLNLAGGVVGLGAEDFRRSLGTGAGQVQFTANGGFAAYGAPRIVNLGGARAPAVWATGSFVPANYALILGATTADRTVTFSNPIDLNGATRTIQADNGSDAVDAIVEEIFGVSTAGIVKTGFGTLRLPTTNRYEGATTIQSGALEVSVLANGGVDSSIGRSSNSGSNLAFGAANAILRYVGTQDATTDRGLLMSSGTGGGATIESSGTGTLSMNNSIGLHYGPTNQSRILTLGGSNAGPNRFEMSISNNGTQPTVVVKSGSGRWINAGPARDYSGSTTINGGVFQLEQDVPAASPLALTGGILGLDASDLNRNLAYAPDGVRLAGSAGFAAYDADREVNLSGGATIDWNSSYFFPGGGTLLLGHSSADRTVTVRNPIHLNGATRTINVGDGAASPDAVMAGALTGTNGSGFIKGGPGTLVLSGVNTYDGPTTVTAGTLLVHGSLGTGAVTVSGGTLGGTGSIGGSVASSGIVAPGASAGRLTVAGNFAQSASGTLVIEVSGATAGTFDVLAIGGPAALDGLLAVVTNGYAPANGDRFVILTAGSLSGAFADTNLPPLAAGLVWDVAYSLTSVVLAVTNPAGASGYDLWAAAITNGLTNYHQSATGDGYPNLLKYATGSSPTNADLLAHLRASRSNGLLTAHFNRNATATDVTLLVEGAHAADNGAAWTGLATNRYGSWGVTTNVVENTNTTPRAVSVFESTSATNRFLRLRVTRP